MSDPSVYRRLEALERAATLRADRVLTDSGTWTPTLIGLTIGGTLTYSVQSGAYQRIGSFVRFLVMVQWSARPVAPTGALVITGLPYTAAQQISVGGYVSATPSSLTLTGIGIDGYIADAETQIRLRQVFAASGAGTLDGATVGASGQILAQGQYTI